MEKVFTEIKDVNRVYKHIQKNKVVIQATQFGKKNVSQCFLIEAHFTLTRYEDLRNEIASYLTTTKATDNLIVSKWQEDNNQQIGKT